MLKRNSHICDLRAFLNWLKFLPNRILLLKRFQLFYSSSHNLEIFSCKFARNLALRREYKIANASYSRAENDPSFFKASRDSPSYSIGLCTGLLPAAAAATARDVGELLTIGRVLIPVAYRLGVQQWKSAHEIESAPGAWAVAVVNVDPQDIENIINAFNDDMVTDPPCDTFCTCPIANVY